MINDSAPEPLPIRINTQDLLDSIRQNSEQTGIPSDIARYLAKIEKLI